MSPVSLDRLVLDRARVRELDRRAIEEYGIPSIVLMENAGRACAEEVGTLLLRRSGGGVDDGAEPETDGRPVVCLCGPGNNGGDGLVVARTLVNRGLDARVFLLGGEAKLEGASDDVRRNHALWTGLGQPVQGVVGEADLEAVREALAGSSVVVDALFGTGLDRPLRAPADELVHLVNASGHPTLAVDVPSGLHGDRGEVLGQAVRADVTVTFVARKPGFTRDAGPEHCGRVVVAEIGIPRPMLEEAAVEAQAARRSDGG